MIFNYRDVHMIMLRERLELLSASSAALIDQLSALSRLQVRVEQAEAAAASKLTTRKARLERSAVRPS
jgi:hypothetical protein